MNTFPGGICGFDREPAAWIVLSRAEVLTCPGVNSPGNPAGGPELGSSLGRGQPTLGLRSPLRPLLHRRFSVHSSFISAEPRLPLELFRGPGFSRDLGKPVEGLNFVMISD